MLHGFHGSLRRNGQGPRLVTGEMRPNKDETMDNFQQECKKALWHAFHMLDTQNLGFVHVSQLKVITSTVGSKMGFEKAEEILNKNTEVSMNFESYFEIVKSELLDKQEQDEQCLGPRLSDVIKTCWALCNFDRNHKYRSFTSEHCMILWRLFNFLSDTDSAGEPEIPVRLDPEEAAVLVREFIDHTGQRNKEPLVLQLATDNKEIPLAFVDFLNEFEKNYVTELSNKAITQGLHQLYDKFILNILDKGKIWKRGYKVKSWKERWMVLTPSGLNYFVGPDEKIQKGVIVFDKDCTIEVPPDRPTHRPNRFVLNTAKKPYEMSAPDVKTKNEWVSGIQQSLSRVGKDPNIQKEAAKERCLARAERRRLAAEENKKRKEDTALLLQRQNELDEANKKRLEDEELLRARLNELEDERKRREEAELKWQEEEALRKAEQERLRQLEEIKRELERLLAEERQAKKDEEIVRNLQARLLEEEFDKREELEKLKLQQEEMLKAEREQKAVLESDRLEQERQLAEAQARLDQLETERAAAAEKMQEASDKLQRAEKDRCILEEKVKLWKTPVGLARLIQPNPSPHVTHRGYGAFCDKDFVRRPSDIDLPTSPSSSTSKEDSNSTNDELEVNVEAEIKEDVSTDNESMAVLKTSEKDDTHCENVFTEAGEDNNSQEGVESPELNHVDTHTENEVLSDIKDNTETAVKDIGEDNSNTIVESNDECKDIVENITNVKYDADVNDNVAHDADVNENVDLSSKKYIELEIQTSETTASQ